MVYVDAVSHDPRLAVPSAFRAAVEDLNQRGKVVCETPTCTAYSSVELIDRGGLHRNQDGSLTCPEHTIEPKETLNG
jgi:hypothetical protein